MNPIWINVIIAAAALLIAAVVGGIALITSIVGMVLYVGKTRSKVDKNCEDLKLLREQMIAGEDRVMKAIERLEGKIDNLDTKFSTQVSTVYHDLVSKATCEANHHQG